MSWSIFCKSASNAFNSSSRALLSSTGSWANVNPVKNIFNGAIKLDEIMINNKMLFAVLKNILFDGLFCNWLFNSLLLCPLRFFRFRRDWFNRLYLFFFNLLGRNSFSYNVLRLSDYFHAFRQNQIFNQNIIFKSFKAGNIHQNLVRQIFRQGPYMNLLDIFDQSSA